MKVLCLYNHAGPSFVRNGWRKVFEYCGHQFKFWDMSKESTFDVFNQFEPDLFIGTTYDIDRALIKNVIKRPKMKIALFGSAYGQVMNDIDPKIYPITLATQNELENVNIVKPDLIFIHVTDLYKEYTMEGWTQLGFRVRGVLNAADIFTYVDGAYREDLACDIGFVGGYWPYKSRNLDRSIVRLASTNTRSVKIFGNQKWPIPQYLGLCDDTTARDLFMSAKICPNISESHSTDLGWDIVERPFKVISSGGFCISDNVKELAHILPDLPLYSNYDEFNALIERYISKETMRFDLSKHLKNEVMAKHTYFDRVAEILDGVNLNKEAKNIRSKKEEYLVSINHN